MSFHESPVTWLRVDLQEVSSRHGEILELIHVPWTHVRDGYGRQLVLVGHQVGVLVHPRADHMIPCTLAPDNRGKQQQTTAEKLKKVV